MKLREFIEEARAEELREGKGGVRLIGLTAPGRGLLVPWPPLSAEEWEDAPGELPPLHVPLASPLPLTIGELDKDVAQAPAADVAKRRTVNRG